MIEKLFLNIIEITLSTSLIILPLLFFGPKLKKKYTSKWKYIIWLCIAIRLMIPINLSFPEAPFNITVPPSIHSASYNNEHQITTDKNIAADINTTSNELSSSNINTTNDNTTSPNNEEYLTSSNDEPKENLLDTLSLSPLKIISLIWLIGTILFMSYQLCGYFIFRKNVLRWGLPISNSDTLNILKNICMELNISNPPKIMTCKKVLSPMALGLFNPIILLPSMNMKIEDLSVILKHELIHIKRHDIAYKLLLSLANTIHWFNPIIYLMLKEAHKDLELYCDEMVIENMDMAYKSKYSNAILAVMHSKTNYNAILSTNFSGGVKTMKIRFKNIFDTSKKRRGLISLSLILSLILLSSSLVACGKNSEADIEKTATGFLKGYYEVSNILLLDELNSIIDEDPLEILSSNENGTIATLSEEGTIKYRDIALKSINNYITSSMEETLLSNRYIQRKLTRASEYEYTLDLTDIKISIRNNNDSNTFTYPYTLQAKLTYVNGVSVTQTVNGNISLIKEDGKWLVNGITEITGITPDKKYYKDQAIVIEKSQPNNSDVYISSDYQTSQTLCDAYIEAMLNSDFNFIGTHTVNALKNTTIEEGQKTWDTIKIDSVEITTSEERNIEKLPHISKAYYELKINVVDPGNSSFDKGETVRWLYLSSSKKGDATHWTVEGLMSSGKPDSLWWNSVTGG